MEVLFRSHDGKIETKANCHCCFWHLADMTGFVDVRFSNWPFRVKRFQTCAPLQG
jgi:hypothetical protein